MRVEVEKQGSVTVLVPRDALTESTVYALRDALDGLLRNGGAPRVVLDMAYVPYVDSAGIECLLELGGARIGGAMQARTAALTDTVREALQLTQVLKRFAVYDSVEAAVRSYR